MTDIKNVLDQLSGMSLTANNDRVADRTRAKVKSYEVGMAKLNALLTKANPSSTRASVIRHAESKARSQQKYYRRATEFFSQPHDEDIFPFLALPAELRLIVYHELLVSDDRLVMTWRCPKKASKQQKHMYIGILMTCKLCESEGLGVLYGQNLFDFEDIRSRNNVAKPLLSRLGRNNFTLIRCIVTEYSAAAEELSHLLDSSANNDDPEKLTDSAVSARSVGTYRFTVPFLNETLALYNIDIDQLRLFAVSIIPYGSDDATTQIMKFETKARNLTWNVPTVLNDDHLKASWLEFKNGKGHMKRVVEGICEREMELKQVDFAEHVEKRLGFEWIPPFINRRWLVYEKKRTVKGT